MAKIEFTNSDHEDVVVAVRHGGSENFRLRRGYSATSESGRGPLRYAWKAANTTISEEEFERYHATVDVDKRIVFGNPSDGRVP